MSITQHRRLIPFVLCLLVMVSGLVAQNIPNGFFTETVKSFSGSNMAPYDWAEMPDGRMFVAHRGGAISIVTPTGASSTIGTIPSVTTGSERGLLSICYNAPYLYAWYTRSGQSTVRLSRWTVTGDMNNANSTNLNIGSEYIVFNNAPDNAFNHNGGTVRFGPDGMLYLSNGDDATCSAAQTRSDLRGKMFRLDVSGLPSGAGGPPSVSSLVPGDNPWNSASNVNERLIIAYGLRNPVTFNIDPQTGDLFIADVGQNAREELDWWQNNLTGTLQGKNYGWPMREGISSYSGCGGGSTSGLTNPIYDYSQSSGGVSVMSGGFVRTQAGQTFNWGSSYDGDVFVLDYFGGGLVRLKRSGNNWNVASSVPGQPSNSYWGTGFAGAWHFDQASDGAIYYIQHSGTYASSSGSLKRLRPAGAMNQVNVISGDNQMANLSEPFPAPLVAQVVDSNGVPIPGGSITVSTTTNVTSSATGTLTADASGKISLNLTASAATGTATVTLSTPGGDPSGTLSTHTIRGMRLIYVPGAVMDILILQIINATNQSAPVSVPYIVMASATAQPLVTPFGSLCMNPFDPTTLVIEDGIGVFGFVSIKGAWGSPSLTNIYNVPSGVLTGSTFNFQSIGYDASVSQNFGWWFSNCVTKTF